MAHQRALDQATITIGSEMSEGHVLVPHQKFEGKVLRIVRFPSPKGLTRY